MELIGNRIYNLDTAVAIGKPPSERLMKGQITRNTVYQVNAGLLFDLAPPAKGEPPPGKFDILIDQNYFAKTKDIGMGRDGNGPIPGLQARDNYHGPDCGTGNLGLNVASLPEPQLPKPDVDNNATFLRFPGGPPAVGPTRVKVGAP